MIDNIPILIINLKNHVLKYNNSLNTLVKTGLSKENIVRLDAIDGNKLDNILDLSGIYCQFLIDNPEYRCSHQQLNSKGGIGCFLSHKACWEMYKDDFRGVIIFEDDLHIPNIDTFKNELNEYFTDLPDDCDVLSFGYSYLFDKLDTNAKITKSTTFFFGMQGYYVSQNGIKKLLDNIRQIDIHVDAYISLLAKLDLINLYFSKESLVKQRNTKSSIQTGNCYKCYLPNTRNLTTKRLFFTLATFLIFIISLCIYIKKRNYIYLLPLIITLIILYALILK